MLSYAHGPSNTALIGETIGACLDRIAASFGDHDALISRHQSLRYTYRQLHTEVERAARGLSHGSKPLTAARLPALHNREATATVIDEARWMHTGDLAVMRDDGYVNIVGRLRDMIIRGGENIYPREIEEFLYTHPKIGDVQVIGVPDLKYGEEVCAWVRLREGATATADEIRQFCDGQIARYKIPRYIRFTTEFPTTVTGKIQKYKMRQVSIVELGLENASRTKTA